MPAEMTWYGVRGVDFLDALDAYTGYFYYVVPPLLAAAALMVAGELVRDPSLLGHGPGHALGHLRERAGARRGAVLTTALALGCTVLIALCEVNFVNVYRGEPDLAPMTAAIKADPARQSRTAVIDLQRPYALQGEWPVVAGLAVQASRTGLPLCVNEPQMAFLFSSSVTCTPAQVRSGYQLAVTNSSAPDPHGWRALWHDAALTVIYPVRSA
jgi:hypothetical protein